MARITDPDDLNQGTEVEFLTGSLLIKLNQAGNLSTDGVSLQTLYSFIKEEWKDDDNLIKFPIPMLAITSEQFELINGWNFSGSVSDPSGSRAFIRDGGWAVVSSSGGNIEEWANITTLGLFDDAGADIAYYLQQDEDIVGFGVAVPQDVYLAGPVNQGIQLYASGTAGNFDYRDFFRIYLREQGKTYGFGDLLVDQNLSALTYRKYALPLTNGTDLKIVESDGNIATQPPYTGMSITYYTESQGRTLGATGTFQFDVIINGNSGTAEEIYEFVQWSLRQTTDIDADAGAQKRGDIASGLLTFIGDTLRTSRGVYIDNFLSVDTNRLEFTETGSTVQTFPFVAAGTIFFNDNLSNDAAAIFKLFFTNDDAGDNTGRDFGTETAIVVQDNSGNPITGSVNGSSSLAFDYDYDGNQQRGVASSGSNAPVTAVAIGLTTAQYVVTTTTITRATTNSVNFVAALERNYLNPV